MNIAKELITNFIHCDNTGCLKVKLLPFISFISKSETQTFQFWLCGGFIYGFCIPKQISFNFYFFNFIFTTKQ